jgi:hypothetical protein
MSQNTLNLWTFVATAALAFFQLLSLIALVIYVVKTWQMANATRNSAETSTATLKQMQDVRDAETAPNVVAFFDVDREKDFLYLIVKNIGRSIAKSVKLQFRPPLRNTEETDLSTSPLVMNGFGDIPPNHEIKILFDRATLYMNAGFATDGAYPLTYYINVSYASAAKPERRNVEFVADLTFYKGFALK